jgi:hypothetical protein
LAAVILPGQGALFTIGPSPPHHRPGGSRLSYDAGRRNLYLTPEGALRLAFLLAAAVERDLDIR